MTYYFIISLPFLYFYGRLLLTNFIIPHFKKRSLYAQMKQRLDWPMIEATEHTLRNLFKGDRAKITSMIYRNLRFIRDKAFVYGEIDFLAFKNILEKTEPQPNEVFYDLGSGTGKAVFCAALYFDLSKSCGIELLPPLYKKANNLLEKATQLTQNNPAYFGKQYAKQIATVQFINDSFLSYDFNDANIIYIAATCLNDDTWWNLITKMADLKAGTRIIVATKRIQHKRFEMIYQGIELMSWGLCPVKIYKIRAHLCIR